MPLFRNSRHALAVVLAAALAVVLLAAPASAALPIPIPGPTRLGGTIGTPTPISPAAGMLVFSSQNGGTGNLSCSLPAPSRGQLTVERIAGGDNRFSCHNDDARSLRLINVGAPLTVDVFDRSDTDDSIGGHHGPWARIIVRQSGTYVVESFETPFHRGSVRLAEYGAGVGYYPAISLVRFGGGKVDGKVSNIIVRGYDDSRIRLVYP